MPADFDVIIVGSGPAGVSAAFPLVEAGLKVMMIDGGESRKQNPFAEPYLSKRALDPKQAEWMIGRDFHSLKNMNAQSPKMRIPAHGYVFNNFAHTNKITSDSFVSIGSMAQGGLSNAWGCGVARLSPQELADFPFPFSDLTSSYSTVARRMGISGANQDDLSDYFGLDEWADAPIKIDAIQGLMLKRYESARLSNPNWNFSLGRARVAALSQNRSGRHACNLSGNCLWGCHQQSLYSASIDLETLKRFHNFTYRSGYIVENVIENGQSSGVQVAVNNTTETILATKVLLAAGTLSTTRLALRALKIDQSVSMQACPVAAFMLWIPRALGQQSSPAFALAQLAFTTRILNNNNQHISGLGSLFNCSGIPISEFTPYLPMTSRYGIDLLKTLLRSCVVGNFYLPGYYTQIKATLNSSGGLKLNGQFREGVDDLMKQGRLQLSQAFRKVGALLMPGSFKLGKPGADLHYGSSLPMRANPAPGETNAKGSLVGMQNIHVIDGASLPSVTEKSHTLTIMANADRIGKIIALELKAALQTKANYQ